MIVLYDANTESFRNNGIGILKDAISCYASEELNSTFDLVLEYKLDGKYAGFLKKQNIIKCPCGTDEDQLFRISKVSRDLNKLCVYANHITYDLIDNMILDSFVQEKSGLNAIRWIFDHTAYTHKFSAFSDISDVSSARYVRLNPIQCLIGNTENSFVNRWGGELLRNNFEIKMLKSRGIDTGYKIKKGKNIQGLNFTNDDSEIITRILPKAYNGILLPELYVDSANLNKFPHPKIKEIEFSDIKLKEKSEDKDGYNTVEDLYIALRNAARLKFTKEKIDKEKINLKIDFIELTKTVEYKKYRHLETLKMGDIVTAIVDDYTAKLKVVKTKYDSIREEWVSLELGDILSNYVSSSLKKETTVFQKLESLNPESLLEQAKGTLTELINAGFGGNVRVYKDRILIMDTNDETTAKHVWQWNLNGLAHSSNGINGPYEIGMTIDGKIVADMITTGKMSVERIEGLSQILLTINRKFNFLEEKEGKDQLILDNSLEYQPIGFNLYGHTEKPTYLYPLENSLKGLQIKGKSEQKIVKKSDDPNLFNLDSWNGKVNSVDWYTKELNGNLEINGNSLVMSNPGNNHQITNSYFDATNESEEMKRLVKDISIKVVSGETYTIAYDCPFSPDSDISENDYQASNCFESLILSYDKDFNFLNDSGIKSIKYENGRYIIKYIPSNNARYISIAFINRTYGELDDTTLTISNISIRKNHSEYIPYEDIEEMPTPTNSSEIKTVPSIRNLFNKEKIIYQTGITVASGAISVQSIWNLTDYIEVEETENYYINKAIIGGTNNFGICFYDSNKNFLMGKSWNTLGYKQNKEYEHIIFDIPSNTKYIRVNLRSDTDINALQIEKGTIVHDYRPFGNYVKIRVTGRNQFNLKKVSRMGYSYGLPSGASNYINIDSYDNNNLSFSITGNGYVYILTNTHYLKSNTDYTLSYKRENTGYIANKNTRFYIYDIDESGEYVENQHSEDSEGNKIYSFTTSTTGMIAFAWGGDNKCAGASSVISNIMILEKTEEKENITYEPSKENEVLIDLQENELCLGDLLNIENGQVHLQKEIGKTSLDGTTNITIYQTSDSNSHGFNISASGVLPNPDSALNTGTIHCDKLPEKSRNHLFLLNQGIAYYKNLSYFIVYIDQCKNMTVTEFKTWLSQNPLTVYYKLAEPQEFQKEGVNIPLFDGINRITLIDDLETEIVATYLNSKQQEITIEGNNSVIFDNPNRNLYPSDNLYPMGVIEGSHE